MVYCVLHLRDETQHTIYIFRYLDIDKWENSRRNNICIYTDIDKLYIQIHLLITAYNKTENTYIKKNMASLVTDMQELDVEHNNNNYNQNQKVVASVDNNTKIENVVVMKTNNNNNNNTIQNVVITKENNND